VLGRWRLRTSHRPSMSEHLVDEHFDLGTGPCHVPTSVGGAARYPTTVIVPLMPASK
jgi:hypothetical protein